MKIPLEKFDVIMKYFLIGFALFLIYQILRKILGGSWITESVILGLVLMIGGGLMMLIKLFSELSSNHKYLKHSFRSLVADFKQVAKDVNNQSVKIDRMSDDIRFLRDQSQ